MTLHSVQSRLRCHLTSAPLFNNNYKGVGVQYTVQYSMFRKLISTTNTLLYNAKFQLLIHNKFYLNVKLFSKTLHLK